MTGGRERGAEADSGWRSLAREVRLRAVLLDVAIVAAWVVVVTAAWRSLQWPTWAYYVAVFGGIAGYSLLAVPLLETVGRDR